MYIKRKIEDDILRYIHRPEIIAIVGPRQCGKTTTLKKIYQKLSGAAFLSFEDQQILSLFENDIKQFINTHVTGKKYVFIDEFQYARNGGKLLKYIYDLHHTKLIISGSSAIDLTVKAIKFLVGRIFILNMHTFNFYEFLLSHDPSYAQLYLKEKINLKSVRKKRLATEQINKLKEYYEEYAIWGGYPEVVLSPSREEKKEVLKNIYNTYFLRDVKNTLGLIDDYKLQKLIRALALQTGNLIEYNELSQISEFSIPTIKKYLNFLSKTYISELVPPFYKNRRKEIVKSKKVYFYDTGMRNLIIDDFRHLESRTDAGSVIENAFWMQMIKNQYPVQFWRNKNNNEVDFIINLGEGGITAMEVKYQQRKCQKLPLAFTKKYPNIAPHCCYLKSELKRQGEGIFLPLL